MEGRWPHKPETVSSILTPATRITIRHEVPDTLVSGWTHVGQSIPVWRDKAERLLTLLAQEEQT